MNSFDLLQTNSNKESEASLNSKEKELHVLLKTLEKRVKDLLRILSIYKNAGLKPTPSSIAEIKDCEARARLIRFQIHQLRLLEACGKPKIAGHICPETKLLPVADQAAFARRQARQPS